MQVRQGSIIDDLAESEPAYLAKQNKELRRLLVECRKELYEVFCPQGYPSTLPFSCTLPILPSMLRFHSSRQVLPFQSCLLALPFHPSLLPALTFFSQPPVSNCAPWLCPWPVVPGPSIKVLFSDNQEKVMQQSKIRHTSGFDEQHATHVRALPLCPCLQPGGSVCAL